jgi:hypothetical protein
VSGIFFVTPLVFTLSIAIAIALGVGCSAVVWLTNSRRPGERRQARDLALFSLSMVLLGMVAGAWLGGFSGAKGAGLFGVARSAAILVLAYAILKHQLLGIDVKIRFAIKTSTVAAVFLAVLFIVANIAQNYLGGKFGVVVGGAAAGMLFFVMAPIQRVAERFAEKAVPVTGASTAAPARPNDGEDAYRRAVRLALRAGISREEAHDLAVLADQLHIGAKRALEIREDLERRAPT